ALELEISNHELREAATRVEQEHHHAATQERERERASALLNATLDSAPVAVALVDAGLRYLQVNAHWTELTGVDRAQHVGRRLEHLHFSHDAFATALDVVTSARETTTPSINAQLSGYAAAGGGDLRHWLLSAAPVSPTSGSNGGVAIALLDVTDHERTVGQ